MPLALADKLTEFLDRAAYVYQGPPYPPTEMWSPEPPRSRRVPAWMDAERRSVELWRPDEGRITPNHIVRPGIKRREAFDQRLAHLDAHGRTPRVCLYALTPLRDQPAPAFAAARDCAADEGWRVGSDHCIADQFRKTDPMHRPGWRWILHLIRAGHIDGVVALAHTKISQHLDEYELQLDLTDHYRGFLALATPETNRVGDGEVGGAARRNRTAHRGLSHGAHVGGSR